MLRDYVTLTGFVLYALICALIAPRQLQYLKSGKHVMSCVWEATLFAKKYLRMGILKLTKAVDVKTQWKKWMLIELVADIVSFGW